jgi:cytochrome c oxidase cbb3-type subunit III
MSSTWSWYIIISTVLTMLGCLWLIVWTNKQHQSPDEIAESESHVWDENIRELNNPLPMWWLWLFILSLVFSAVYLVVYPGLGSYEGTFDWSQENQYDKEVAAAEERYGPMFAQYGAMEVSELVNDAKAMSIGRSLFANYCSQCHGSTAQGARGFPNLTDGAWLYGGEPEAIEFSIMNGRSGVMPALAPALGADLDAMISYVMALPDGQDTSSPAHSKYSMFCIACHGADATGNQALGAPNLTDDIWLYGSSEKIIRQTLTEGRNGVMPAHSSLIGPDRARILAAYVYSLSSGSD